MSEGPRAWILWTAGLCLGLLLLPFFWPCLPLFFATLCLSFAALAGLVSSLWKGSRKDRFDLDELRRLHEREQVRSLREEVEHADADQAFCTFCGEVYDPRLRACPNCKRI